MRPICIFLILMLIHPLQAQEAFDCNSGTFYQVISGSLKAYDPITGSYSEALHTYTQYNAGGYNGVDDYLYAIKKGDNHLLRIAKDMVIDLGAITPSGTVAFGGGYAADVDPEGDLWVFQNNNKRTFHKITNLAQYNGSTSPIFEVVEADVTAPSTCADIVYVNGAFYGGSRGKIFKWDLSTGTPIFSSKIVANLPTSTFGAAYTDSANRLYFSDNNGGLYVINDYEGENPTATMLNLTETTNSNDGFKCANGVSPLDKDQDGILDAMDADVDGDGILNVVECNGSDPYGDDDDDGMYNYLDTDVSGNGDNVVQDAYDRDGDGNPDFLDIDSDNDGIYDIVEAGQGDKDENNDGVYNANDTNFQDIDNDGVADVFDVDQNGTPIVLPDFDNDGIADCYDIDSDNDGVVDIIEGQLSASFIGISSVDQDRDGLDDNFDPDFGGTTNGTVNTDDTDGYDHLDIDSDNDGVSDYNVAYDSDGDGTPETTLSGIDQDNDGLDNNFDQRKTTFDAENGGQTPASFPIPAICDRYNYLGEFNSNGKPLYLDGQDIVTAETVEMINNALPEGYPVPDFNPHYISSGYDTDIIVEGNAEVWVTFVGEGAGYKNTLGFYTYDINNPSQTIPQPEDITIIFPNVSAVGSGGELEIGDKVKIGSFAPNTGIGWVLLADAWSNGCVDTGNWQLHSNPDYNPESDESLRYHNVLLNDPNEDRIILGFEDIRRDYASCDQDFNDALFYITANPISAIRTDNYADIKSATDVTSANNGGLESDGSLANLIAARNFKRAKTNKVFNTKKRQQPFKPESISYKSANQEDLSIFFPEKGAFGTETAYVSSPDDLIGITNAEAVFSVDYYQGEQRVAAGLATTTVGSIYDHSKTICDRLNGSKLLDVRTIKIRKHTIISSTIERATGEIEYTLGFSIKKAVSENELYSLWNIDSYPEGDYINFQLWGGSMAQVANMANHIIDELVTDKPLRSHEVRDHIPTVFVEQGFYKNGELILNIINKSQSKIMNFDSNIRVTEVSETVNLKQTITLSGDYNEQIKIPVGYAFDIGFSIVGEHSSKIDALYLADGPWGVDYAEEGALINYIEVTEHNDMNPTEGTYIIERGMQVTGEVKETFNIFRNVLAGDATLDVSEYNALQFEMQSDQDVEVILVTKDLENWNDRVSFVIPAHVTQNVHTIDFSSFKTAQGAPMDALDIQSIVFSIQGDYQNYKAFSITIDKVAFIDKNVLSVTTYENDMLANAFNYPNPFQNFTIIRVPQYDAGNNVRISVVDMLGKIVRDESVQVNLDNEIFFQSNTLKPGIYRYIITTTQQKKYRNTFLIY